MDGQLAVLSREVALLTASLQREKQRRAAVAEHAREAEHRAAAATQRLRQVDYANRRLEERLEAAQTASDERLQVKISAASDEDAKKMARLEADVAHLLARLAEASQAQEELQKERDLALTTAEEATAAAAEAETRQAAEAAAAGPGPGEVGAAVVELQAIVPQYRASIAALQGRVAVLGKQLEAAQGEAAAAAADAVRWRAAAEAGEASFAGAAVKAHAQEAAALAAASSQQAAQAAAEAEAARWRRHAEEAEGAAAATAAQAQRSQREAQAAARLAAAQTDTIARLEATVREQQEDILAALALVCAPGGGHTPPLRRYREEVERGEAAGGELPLEGIDASLDLLEKRVGVKEGPAAAPQEATGASGGSGEDWTIPAAGAPVTQALPEKQRIKAALSPTKVPKQRRSGGGAPAMTALAADIAALRDALRQVL